MNKSESFLATCIDQQGYAALLASTARSPRVSPLSANHLVFSKASVNGHPLDRGEREEVAENRRQELAELRRRIVEILGCEKCALVLFHIFDSRVRRSEIAKLLGKNRSEITDEIERLQRIIAKNWPSSKVSIAV